ncbi:LPXTG cell wall anchor domain-containing protein [Listeria booriae]|uniref:LPXTG cell wall anchor domain-containing protein n=1 Tax=Listeria booriae TaxID=1552123 RepID=UPI001625D58F|nr:LPXTG cell wall anchor domain-containing protein [Listeria booriae]MBC1801517.1 LPXTG cell wall anchor domain-containing protein [Listeria booriae]
MYMKEKTISIMLVCGLTFSTVSPVFAEEMTSQQETQQQLVLGNHGIEAKQNVQITQGRHITPTDFVQIYSQKYKPQLTFKDGVVASTETVGTFETTIVAEYNDGTTEEFTVSYTILADPSITPDPDPVTPTDPEEGQEPVTPVDPEPETPVTPDPEPTNPEPETPVTPVQPVDPDPVTPVDPVKPIDPVKPDPKPEVTVLATAKTNVTVELNDSALLPSQFVSRNAHNVKLSFNTQPVTNTLGTHSVQILASKGSATQTITVNYTVVDTTKPFIQPQEDIFYVWPNDEWTAEELVTATDNSGFVKVYFQNGQTLLDTTTPGAHSTVIVAEDANGNISTIDFQYQVISVAGMMLYSSPTVNFDKSTDTDIYGGTEPDTTLFVITEDSEELLAETRVDYSGAYHAVLSRPLQPGETAYLIAVDDNGGVSDVTHYTYGSKQVPEVKAESIVKSATDSQTTAATPNNDPSNEIVATKVDKDLPKTGDSSSKGLTVIGLLLSATALLYLRKRS